MTASVPLPVDVPAAEPAVAVALLAWPREEARRHHLTGQGQPRLLVLEAGAQPPPAADCLEDWIHAPAAEGDVRARIEALALRARHHQQAVPHLDDDGCLRLDADRVQLPPIEGRLARELVDNYGRVVGASRLLRAGWPQGGSSRNNLDVQLHRLRRRILPLGLVIRTVRRRGWILEAASPAGEP
jgi:two-component system, OmpR family, response regulator